LESFGPLDEISVRKELLSLLIFCLVTVVVNIKAVGCVHEEGYPAQQTHENVEDLLLDKHLLCLFTHSASIEPSISEYQGIASHPKVNQILYHLEMTKQTFSNQ
jgi:hypothetical protein